MNYSWLFFLRNSLWKAMHSMARILCISVFCIVDTHTHSNIRFKYYCGVSCKTFSEMKKTINISERKYITFETTENNNNKKKYKNQSYSYII